YLSAGATGAADPLWDAKLVLDCADPASCSPVNIAVRGTNLYVFGSFTNIGGLLRDDLAKLSTLGPGQADSNWRPSGLADLGSRILDYRGLAVTDEALFVSWIDIGPEAFTAGVLKFDATGAGARDTNWNATFDKSVDLLLAVPSGLFAAGNFRLCNGQVSLSLAKLHLLTGARGRDFNAQVLR